MRKSILVSIVIVSSIGASIGCSSAREDDVEARVDPSVTRPESVRYPKHYAGMAFVDTAQDSLFGQIYTGFSHGYDTYFVAYEYGPTVSGYTYWPLTATQAATPVAGDFDGDGYGDIALTSKDGWNTIPVAFGRQGNLEPQPTDHSVFTATNYGVSGFAAFTIAAGQAGAQAVSGDFNGDGRDDLALSSGQGWNTVPLAISNGDGTFHATNYGVSGDMKFPVEAAAGLAWNSSLPIMLVSGDFNHDGRADIALVGGTRTAVPVAYSNGDGTWNASSIAPSSAFLSATQRAHTRAFGGDYNGDGLADIALVDMTGANPIMIGFGNASGGIDASNCAETTPDGTNLKAASIAFHQALAKTGAQVVTGDFDADGRLDFTVVQIGTATDSLITGFSLAYTPNSNCTITLAISENAEMAPIESAWYGGDANLVAVPLR